MAGEASVYKGRIAAVILTIRQDETDAVGSRLGPMEEVRGRVTYHVARVQGQKGELIIALHRIREQGTGPAQSAANSAIEDLEPRLVVLVGIAGAVPSDDFSLGDVIVATRIADLRIQALLPDQTSELSVRSDRIHPGLVDRLTNLSDLPGWSSPSSIKVPEPEAPLANDRFTADPLWNEKVRKSLEARFVVRPRLPRHITGELGSQDALVKDAAVLQTWLQAVRKVEAVEMEAAGVMEAAARTDALFPVLVVRGLSDVVGYKREAAWTTYACHTAAAFLLALLSSGRLDGVGPLRMSDDGEPDAPHVFVSYTPDSDTHKAKALELTDRLCSDGVHAWIDRYVPPPLEGWARWRERQVNDAQDVLLVCSEEYHRRFAEICPTTGRGRLVPVALSNQDRRWVPDALAGARCYVVDVDYEALRQVLPQSGRPVPKRHVQSAGEIVSHPIPTPTRGSRTGKTVRHVKRILVVAANRDDDPPLALGREVREILARLRSSSSTRFEVHIAWAATADDVRRELLKVKPHVLHFCGHGNTAGPILERTERGNETRDGATIVDWLKVVLKGMGVEIALMNFCDSQDMLDQLAEAASVIVGPINKISDEHAIVFSSAFYMALASGGSASFSYYLATSALNMIERERNTVKREHDIHDIVDSRSQRALYGIRCQTVDEIPSFESTGRRRPTFAFFASEPQARHRLSLDRTFRRIVEVFPRKTAFYIEQRWASRPVDFLHGLMTTQPTIVHVAGHGTVDGAFVFEHDWHADGVKAPHDTFAQVLTAFHHHIACAVLMFEHSARVARALADVVDCVVGVEGSMPVDAEAIFSNGFYQLLDEGKSYRDAFRAGTALLPKTTNEANLVAYGRDLDGRPAGVSRARRSQRVT